MMTMTKGKVFYGFGTKSTLKFVKKFIIPFARKILSCIFATSLENL